MTLAASNLLLSTIQRFNGAQFEEKRIKKNGNKMTSFKERLFNLPKVASIVSLSYGKLFIKAIDYFKLPVGSLLMPGVSA